MKLFPAWWMRLRGSTFLPDGRRLERLCEEWEGSLFARRLGDCCKRPGGETPMICPVLFTVSWRFLLIGQNALIAAMRRQIKLFAVCGYERWGEKYHLTESVNVLLTTVHTCFGYSILQCYPKFVTFHIEF